MSNTIIYAEEWATKLQERLSERNKWKDICRVEYTNSRVLHNPYMSDATVQSGTRGAAYTHQDATLTDESITINQFKILPQLIDRADLAQSTFATQMALADRQGLLLNEAIETAMLASHASWTNLGDTGGGTIGLSSTAITISATNIDDVIRAIKEQIRSANGQDMLDRNGGFIVWRSADFTLLEAFMQANGFNTADYALKNGGSVQGVEYMGLTHYSSNKNTAGHLFAGVKNVFHLGIVKDTYGQIVITQDPTLATGVVGTIGQTSGIGIVSRVDYAFKAWFTVVPILFDINVN